MISFNLRCAGGHEFEGWFSTSDDYDGQRKKGLVTCPACGDGNISKALMAPNVGAKANGAKASDARAGGGVDTAAPVAAGAPPTMRVAAPAGAPGPGAAGPGAPGPGAVAAVLTELRALQRKVEKECDFVGDRFAEEARRIHYGEAEERGIYGRSTPEDAEALAEEGIEVSAMPWLPPDN